MTALEVEVYVNTRNPKSKGKLYYQLMYGDEFGGRVTTDVKISGEVYIPMTSWATGKSHFKDVKIPHNTNIISLSIHEKHENIDKIGDFELVKDFRISRGVYCSGLLRVAEHENLNARVIIGYELKLYSRKDCGKAVYKKIQKKKIS